MRSKREPEMSFWMTLYGKNIDLPGIEELLNIKLDNDCIRVPNDLPEDPDGPGLHQGKVLIKYHVLRTTDHNMMRGGETAWTGDWILWAFSTAASAESAHCGK